MPSHYRRKVFREKQQFIKFCCVEYAKAKALDQHIKWEALHSTALESEECPLRWSTLDSI